MKKIVFKKSDYSLTSSVKKSKLISEEESEEYYTYELRLIYEILRYSPESVKNFLLDKKCETISHDTYLIIIYNNKITIEDFPFGEEENTEFFEMEKQELIDLIDKWYELRRQNPDEIILHKEANKFRLEPVFYN